MISSSQSRRVRSIVLAVLMAAGGALAAPPSTAFTYQGELRQGGVGVTQVLPMNFRIFNVATGGQALATLSQPGVNVVDGLFTVQLAPGASVLTGAQSLWLEVVVEGNVLTPRQLLTGSPYSLSTRGITVDAQNRVGIGTSTPAAKLDVVGGMNIFDSAHEGVNVTTNSFRIFETANEDEVYSFDGTTGSHVFSSGGVPSVVMSGAGNVGIGTASPQAKLHVVGPAGDNTVRLPNDSISAAEILDEAGVAAKRSIAPSISIGSNFPGTVLASVVIQAPSAGYVVVNATAGLRGGQTFFTSFFRVNGVAEADKDGYSNTYAAGMTFSLAANRVFPVNAGANTFEWMALRTSDSSFVDLQHPSMSLIFLPTAYGTVNMTAP